MTKWKRQKKIYAISAILWSLAYLIICSILQSVPPILCVCVCVCMCVCEWFMLWSLKFYVHVITEKSFLAFLSVTNFLAIIFLSEIRKRLYIWYVHNILRKTNISYLLIGTSRYALQGVRNVSFLGNFADDL